MAKTVRTRASSARKKQATATQPSSQAEVLPLTPEEPIQAPSDVPPSEEQATPQIAPSPASGYPTEALYFDAAWYLETYPDVSACGIDPVEHFMTHGYLEGRDPNGSFSVAEYIAANPDIPLTINPFLHFIMHGAAEGRPLRR
ncbi:MULTISPECIES: hypothetical protein [Asaia]|uniref:hypothetical protein n=1 Tax=Asaia TaxID=91914 RepID=UPI002FC2B41E